ncbi:hypothetical protein JOC78_000778 [Bacillus ectoiniformans]|nr:hypothetical protein [Bacillus ectoiniformans]MBM7647838.1 hypothetical protein [Bacillus ectoiniformans]
MPVRYARFSQKSGRKYTPRQFGSKLDGSVLLRKRWKSKNTDEYSS